MKMKLRHLAALFMFASMLFSTLVIPNNEIIASPTSIPALKNNEQQGISSDTAPSEAFDADGRIKSDFEGSFSAKGLSVTLGENGEPLFKPAGSANSDIPDEPSAAGTCGGNFGAAFTHQGLSGGGAMARDSSGNIYVVANVLEGMIIDGIAKWDGASWTNIGAHPRSGSANGFISDMVTVGTDLYVIGQFTEIGKGSIPVKDIAKWDGSTWSAVGTGATSTVFGLGSLGTDGTNLYVGGTFTLIGGVAANNIAKWDGTSWSPLGAGLNGGVGPMDITPNGWVYVGGTFTQAGGSSANGVARWDGSNWSPFFSGVSGGVVRAIKVDTTDPQPLFWDIYVAGSITTAGGLTGVNNIAKYEGSSGYWERMGNSHTGPFGSNDQIYALEIYGSHLLAGGTFTSVAGVAGTNGIARWNLSASTWSAVGAGLDGAVYNFMEVGNDMWVAGQFRNAGGAPATSLAKLTGTTWTRLLYGTGIDGPVYAMAVSGSDVYIAGDFRRIGDLTVNRIAKWNGSSWSALGAGFPSRVNALAVSGSNVYAGGDWSTAQGAPANDVARWNGTAWSALGSGGFSGTGGEVKALAAVGTAVFVGGAFTIAGGATRNNIAKWESTTNTWSTIGTGSSSLNGVDAQVNAFAVDGTDLYVGGAFATAGGISVKQIAKLDTTTNTWSALGSGMGAGWMGQIGQVFSIAVSGSTIYVAGNFEALGDGTPAMKAAKWDGGSWTPLGSGIGSSGSGIAYTVAVSGSKVYYGGNFQTAGGAPARMVAVWNGSSWSALGSGMNYIVNAIAPSSNGLLMAGEFDIAGCQVATKFTVYYDVAFTGASNSNWHTGSNWTGNAVPNSSTVAMVSGGNVSITSSNATVGSLQINSGRTVTIASGRTLTVNGTLTLIGNIEGDGEVILLGCPDSGEKLIRIGASYIKSALQMCIRNNQTKVFPIGTNNSYSPVTISNPNSVGYLRMRAFEGAYPTNPDRLPTNRLLRWWRITNVCSANLTDGDLPSGCIPILYADKTFRYKSTDITAGNPNDYRLFVVNGGSATVRGGTNDYSGTQITRLELNPEGDFTLGEGSGPTAAPAVISGRVLDANGRPVANASVLMTKPNGEVVTVKTNSFGKYLFNNLVSGESYVVMAQTRHHLYMPKVISLNEDLADLDFRP